MNCKCGYPITPPLKTMEEGFLGAKEAPTIEDYTCPECKRQYKIRGYNGKISILEKHTPKNVYRRPPTGLEPHTIWVGKRIQDIKEAMDRYTEANKSIPIEWVNEYNELLENLTRSE
ncbi:hypothetical protein BJV85_002090 [Clostridium acetobutylicum]|uniref:Uncharacterized protein n=1 Tax=Clostridium acetobutylicum (strain ATCC 824 / DSM 792 / JCM 1419 / IAM 19013 / LMG 5710 / NBRC 13948 / NRRL B-527 / VKM B-1787 / 2291 / W) TaxID=272562 RepID=Q97HV2_CLOAB|nr:MULTISPECIES: hypothetical protein [Clostridium]AAK79868.1 Hypothetical protein CA_C1905 [Clostridium acetobutylicum ATCC 824]ADZ20955.1 Conserved hypothetical protein [Clostridium acetobutylicum EA 2018]AEI32044.1 hypothetical protein SMB_G1931 [Clostridium acetobutylicum DSM 1731]AWV79702.1 hypothetical protein DK921_06230 [Clostridium acetobutylicum]MBC2394321.1 hypothetical protein [Clostridium acetobutylicum]